MVRGARAPRAGGISPRRDGVAVLPRLPARPVPAPAQRGDANRRRPTVGAATRDPYRERKPGYAVRWTEERVRAELSDFCAGAFSGQVGSSSRRRDANPCATRSDGWEAPSGGRPSSGSRCRTSSRDRVAPGRRSESSWSCGGSSTDATPGHTARLDLRGRPGLAGAHHHGGAAYWARRLEVSRAPRRAPSGPRTWSEERKECSVLRGVSLWRSCPMGRRAGPCSRSELAADGHQRRQPGAHRLTGRG